VTANDAGRPRPRFRRRSEPVAGAADPEALFGELPRTPSGVGALWSHQADQLRTYAKENHRDTPDVALELPTGSGKTLVGLLIAEWRRRTLSQRVVYACPTKQLARQVLQKANAQGIPAVLLIGSHWDWDQAELARYTRGDAIALTTYSAIFNFSSHLDDAHTLVFDDAHAAEGFVAEAWALSVDRAMNQYEQLFDALGDSVEPSFVARMVAPAGPTSDAREVRLIPIGAIARHAEDIDRVLAGLKEGPSYRFKMLRANLSSCLFYVSRREFYVRPMIPPTFQHEPFTGPTQRLYLTCRRPSVTLASWNGPSAAPTLSVSPHRRRGTEPAVGVASSSSLSSQLPELRLRRPTKTPKTRRSCKHA
jgi:DEAD/DEAH box helicase